MLLTALLGEPLKLVAVPLQRVPRMMRVARCSLFRAALRSRQLHILHKAAQQPLALSQVAGPALLGFVVVLQGSLADGLPRLCAEAAARGGAADGAAGAHAGEHARRQARGCERARAAHGRAGPADRRARRGGLPAAPRAARAALPPVPRLIWQARAVPLVLRLDGMCHCAAAAAPHTDSRRASHLLRHALRVLDAHVC